MESGIPRGQRRGGAYRAYLPDPLTGLPLAIDRELAAALAGVERSIRRLTAGPGAGDLDGLSRFLMRSEAIASSMIEGITPSPQQVALAELAQDEPVRGFSDQARLVANNVTVLREASQSLATAEEVTVEDVVRLHAALLPGDAHRGLRRVQNWIGGSSWHPLDSEFVPPPHEMVPGLMSDLVDYVNGAAHSPLVQAGLVHAQFETIHPFTDGNGRTGRALVSAVLRHRGVARNLSVPISSGLLADTDAYFAALTAYRHGEVEPIVEQFSDAAERAIANATQLQADVAAVREEVVASATRRTRNIEVMADLCATEPAFNADMVVQAGISRPTAYRICKGLSELGLLHRERAIGGVDVWTVVGLTDALDAFAARAGRRNITNT